MRLLDQEVEAICNQVLRRDPEAQVYLYGSKLQSDLKGGDIDLLVLSEILTLKDKVEILIDLKDILGDQKIDLTILSHAELEMHAFFKDILASALPLVPLVSQ